MESVKSVDRIVILDVLGTFYEQTVQEVMDLNTIANSDSLNDYFLDSHFESIHDHALKLKDVEVHPNLIYGYQDIVWTILESLKIYAEVRFYQEVQVATLKPLDMSTDQLVKVIKKAFQCQDIEFVIADDEDEKDQILVGLAVIAEAEYDFLEAHKEFLNSFKRLKFQAKKELRKEKKQKKKKKITVEKDPYENQELDGIAMSNLTGEYCLEEEEIEVPGSSDEEAKTTSIDYDVLPGEKLQMEEQAQINNQQKLPEIYTAQQLIESKEPNYKIKEEIARQKESKRTQLLTLLSDFCLNMKFKEFQKSNLKLKLKQENFKRKWKKIYPRESSSQKDVKFAPKRRKVNGKVLKWLKKEIK